MAFQGGRRDPLSPYGRGPWGARGASHGGGNRAIGLVWLMSASTPRLAVYYGAPVESSRQAGGTLGRLGVVFMEVAPERIRVTPATTTSAPPLQQQAQGASWTPPPAPSSSSSSPAPTKEVEKRLFASPIAAAVAAGSSEKPATAATVDLAPVSEKEIPHPNRAIHGAYVKEVMKMTDRNTARDCLVLGDDYYHDVGTSNPRGKVNLVRAWLITTGVWV
ncbi:hypothetical protein ACP70R_036972 [Stipagrostis hirtigluma subsp. patula]